MTGRARRGPRPGGPLGPPLLSSNVRDLPPAGPDGPLTTYATRSPEDAAQAGPRGPAHLARRRSAVPFYPPTDLVFYRSRPQIPLNVDAGAQALANYLRSCRLEMELALRTMGKRSLAELGPEDLVGLDRDVAATAGVRFAGDPREPAGGPEGRREPREAVTVAAER